jgi:hypothetical protein
VFRSAFGLTPGRYRVLRRRPRPGRRPAARAVRGTPGTQISETARGGAGAPRPAP